MFMKTSNIPKPSTESDLSKLIKKVVRNLDTSRGSSVQLAECISNPRTIKSHLPMSFLPTNLLNKAKVIKVVIYINKLH